MPNHVHILLQSKLEQKRVCDLVGYIKRHTAREINRRFADVDGIWMREYYDRYLRESDELHCIIDYIEANPVVAGLCPTAQDWQYSSAYSCWAGYMDTIGQ